jgi:four helix bundle protein
MNTEQQPTSFHAFNLSLSLIRQLAPLVARMEQHDRDLGRQLRKAASSVALNLGEGRKRTGRDRTHLWRVAGGSAEESRVCLHVAAAWGHLPQEDMDDALNTLDQLLAICWRLTHP